MREREGNEKIKEVENERERNEKMKGGDRE